MKHSSIPRAYFNGAIIFCILLPALSLGTRSGSTAVLFALLVLCGLAFAHCKLGGLAPQDSTFPAAIAIALVAPLASSLISTAGLMAFQTTDFEKSVRFALAIPVLWLLSQSPTRQLRHIQWGFMAGAASGSLVVIYGMLSGSGRDYAALGGHYNAVTLANLVLLFGFSTLLTLSWTLTRHPRAEAGLKIAVVMLSIVGVKLSGTRSSWMLLPILLVLAFLAFTSHLKTRTRVLLAMLGIAIVAAIACSLYVSNPRFVEIVSDVSQYMNQGNRDTSVGVRLQLWQAAIALFQESPWFGIGASNFHPSLQVLAERGVVTQFVAQHFGETHNDFIQALMSKGIGGLVAMGMLYLLPAAWFARRALHPSKDVRVAAQLGLLLCLGYTLFGLTELMFRNMRSVPIYSILLVVLASLATVRDSDAGVRDGSAA